MPAFSTSLISVWPCWPGMLFTAAPASADGLVTVFGGTNFAGRATTAAASSARPSAS